MLNVTQEQKTAFLESTPQEIQITATPETGTAITITNANIVQGSFSIDRSSVSGNDVEIGNVSSAELIMVLNNSDGTFDNFTLEGATLEVEIRPQGVGSFISMGKFVVDEITRNKTTINVVALDYMVALDVEMDRTIFADEETAPSAIGKILTAMGITTTPVLDLVNDTVTFTPSFMHEGATYRDFLICILEITGTNAYFIGDTFYATWYSSTVAETLTTANRVMSDMQGYGVEITGVVVEDGETVYEVGTKDYPITITSNNLITSVNVTAILTGLQSRLVGFTYQPFTATTLPMPWLMPMDKINYVKDETTHPTIITNAQFILNQNTPFEAKGQSPLAKGYAKKAMTKAQENNMKALEQKTEQNVQEQIDNIEVGGVNLLMDTNAPSLDKVFADKNRAWGNVGYTGAVGSFITITNPPSPHIENGIQIAVNNAVAGSGKTLVWYVNGEVQMVEGEVYTLSCYARIKSGTQARLALYYGSTSKGAWDVWSQDITSTEWVRVTRTFTANDQYMTANSASIYIGILGNYLSTVEICGFQLEQGNKATAYNRQLDTQTQVEEINNYFWHDNLGAHVSDTPKVLTGNNVLIDSDSVDIRKGTDTLATFYADETQGFMAVFDPNSNTNAFTVGGGQLNQYQNLGAMFARKEAVYNSYNTFSFEGDNDVTSKERIGLLTDDGSTFYGATSASKVIQLNTQNGSNVTETYIELLSDKGTSIYDSGGAEVLRATWDGSIGFVGRDIPASANLNNYRMQGVYTCRQNANAETVTNSPTQRAFRLEVTSITKSIGDTNYVVQKLKTYEADEYVRYGIRTNNTWSWSVWRVIVNRLSPTLNWNNTYVTNDRGGTVLVRDNVLYATLWFKTSQQIPNTTPILTLSGLTRNFTRGYYPIYSNNGVVGQVSTSNGGTAVNTNVVLPQNTSYRFIDIVMPLLE